MYSPRLTVLSQSSFPSSGFHHPYFFGYLMKVLAVKQVGVVGIDLADAQFVRRDKDFAVGDLPGHPQAASALRAGRHFDDPTLFLVPDGKGFTGSVITVFLDELPDEEDRFPGGLASFRRHPAQFGTVENQFPRDGVGLNFRPVGALAEHELVLVHDTVTGIVIGIGMGHLGNIAQRNALGLVGIDIGRTPVGSHVSQQFVTVILRSVPEGAGVIIHRPESAGLMIRRRDINEALVEEFAVVRMSDHYRAVLRGPLRDKQGRAGQKRRPAGKGSRQDRRHRDRDDVTKFHILTSFLALF